MKKITRIKDTWGQEVVYVQKCERFLYEKQEIDIKQEKRRIYDIMYQVENYCNNSQGDRYD